MAKDDVGRQNALDYEQRRLRRRAAEQDRARGLTEDEVQRRRAVRKGQYEATREQMLSTRLQVEINEARKNPEVMYLDDLAAVRNLNQQ